MKEWLFIMIGCKFQNPKIKMLLKNLEQKSLAQNKSKKGLTLLDRNSLSNLN